MTGPDYSDDEIDRLVREVLGEENPAPTPSIPRPRSMSRADVARELSIDEILKKSSSGSQAGTRSPYTRGSRFRLPG